MVSPWFRNSKISTQLIFFSRFAPPTTHYITRVFVGRCQACFSTLDGTANEVVVKVSLAKSLASIGAESLCVKDKESKVNDKPQTIRVNMKRFLEMRIKKRVKQHYVNGMFHDLFRKVVADPRTLMDAFNSIRLFSNVDVNASGDVGICFESLSEELVNEKFDVLGNTFTVWAKERRVKEVLVLPSLKLKIVQEALRIVLEVVFRPHFSKISHGGRSGKGRLSALKYTCKETGNPNFWFTLHVTKKVDSYVLAKLILTIEDKITDPLLSGMIQRMFDARVLNLEFGEFPKGQGLPQEGVLSPVLMNIYLDLFDDEFQKMSMRYEALDSCSSLDEKQPRSKLRNWFRRQIKGNTDIVIGCEVSDVRVHCCRFMDELFFAVSGPYDTALSLKHEVQNYLKDSLLLGTRNGSKIIPCNRPHGIPFCGASVTQIIKDSPAVKLVHKLKDKVSLFASQRWEAWDAGTIRIGKKVLGHGLKKVKESEIKHLCDNNSLLSKISHYRKAGMETDHWYQHLLKIWVQDLYNKNSDSEEYFLSKCIGEPSLPPALRDSFYEFQRLVEEYKATETESLLSLLPSSDVSKECQISTKILAPVELIKQCLYKYGIVNVRGYACAVRRLILQDKSEIVEWFSGIVCKWVKWYSESENFEEVKLIISDQVRMSCIRTLAVKYRIHESVIEKRFESDLSRIPFCQDVKGEISEDSVDSFTFDYDEGLMYGISYSGACQLSLARLVSHSSRPHNCSVFGCSVPAPCLYILHVMEKQKFPGRNTGFSSCIHPSLNGRQIGLCKRHLTDLYLGDISLQCIDFSSRK